MFGFWVKTFSNKDKSDVVYIKAVVLCFAAVCFSLPISAAVEEGSTHQLGQVQPALFADVNDSQHWAWLFSQPDDHFTIELVRLKRAESIQRFFLNHHRVSADNSVYFPPINTSHDRHLLLYGSYASQAIARKRGNQLQLKNLLVKPISALKHRFCYQWKQSVQYQQHYLQWCSDDNEPDKHQYVMSPMRYAINLLDHGATSSDVGIIETTFEAQPAMQFAEVTHSEDAAVEHQPQSAPYIDQLIDPNIGEEQIVIVEPTKTVFGAYNNIEITSQYYDQEQGQDFSFDGFNTTVAYTVITTTDNYGDLRFRLRAVDNDLGDGIGFSGGFDGETERETGLEDIRLEQINFPLSERLVMHNVIGTHKGTGLASITYADQGLVSQRFTNADPDILGVSSGIADGRKSIQASIGRVETIDNDLVSDYDKSNLDLARIRVADYSRPKNAYKADLWATQSRAEGVEDDAGLRLTWSSFWSRYLISTLDIVKTRDSYALLTGARYNKLRARGELGMYYFGDEVNWINQQVGDDNAGIYYRYANRRGPTGYGVNAEYRREGVSGDVPQDEKDIRYLAGNMNYRLNRNSRISGNYSIRDISAYDSEDNSTQHRLKAAINKKHNLNTASNLSLGYRLKKLKGDTADENTTKRVNYSLSHNFLNDSEGSLSLGYVEETNKQVERNTYSINTNWKRRFTNNQTLNIGIGYNQNLGIFSDSDSWTMSLAHGWPINDKLSLSSSVNYNAYDYQYAEERFDGLFVGDTISEIDADSLNVNRLTAFFRLNYEFGEIDSARVLGQKRGKAGSGSVRGTLFVDLNRDGIRQPNEKGLANVLIYLNSIHATKTDSKGEFVYRRVGVGEQMLFIDESKLPLPYSLNGTEFTPFIVKLRSQSSIDIPIQIIQ